MQLTDEQLETFRRDGVVLLPARFSAAEVALLRDAFDAVCAEDTPANLREKRSGAVRTAMGLHLRHCAFARLVEQGGLPSATGPAATMLVFGDLLVLSSPPNLSPFDRRIFSLILNPVGNAYTCGRRPDWKHHRALDSVQPVHGALDG